jgi:hypothetical protein
VGFAAVVSFVALGAEERIKKAVGPDLAHGSWFVR